MEEEPKKKRVYIRKKKEGDNTGENAVVVEKVKRKYTGKVKPVEKVASPSKVATSPKVASLPKVATPPKPIKIKRKTIKKNQLELMQNPPPPIIPTVSVTDSAPIVTKKEVSETEKNIDLFKTKGYSVLDTMTREKIQEIIRVCKDAYYNKSTPLLTDNEYDIVEDYYKTKWPTSVEVGAPISGKNKVTLPYKMASMDKIKPDSNALANWMKTYNGPYVLSCKLDGVSGLYTCDENGKHHLYTRGDGSIGQDISHLIRPLRLPTIPKGTAIRGEFIMPKHIFETKYKSSFANARNLVSGMVNRKGVDEKIEHLHYVAYEVIQPTMKPSEQLLFIKQLGLRVVQNQVTDTLSNGFLSATLIDWRTNYDYEIDGVIVTDNYIYPRVDGNPEHAFAFKMVLSDQVAEAKVVDVIWTPSKDGYLKPRVRIEPIQLAGVRIEYATGFNGKFIQDNRIGLGAIITLVRSGDVIPYIKSVTIPAEQPLMPKEAYKWTDTLVDILLEDSTENKVVLEKNITNFFVYLEVEGLSSGNVKRIMDSGLTSVKAILQAKKEDLLRVEGFKQKMVDKIYNSIQDKANKASLVDIVVASSKLGRGFGKKKVEPIFEKYPNILVTSKSRIDKIEMVKEIAGIGPDSAKEFVDNIPEVLSFLHDCELEHKLFEKREIIAQPVASLAQINNPFYGKKVVLTKTRDKDIISFIEKSGGSIEDSMKKEVFMLIVKTAGDKSSKVDYAIKNGIPILSVDEFKAKYL